MASPPDEHRLQVALRMKAARYLVGRAAEDGRVIALPVSELAKQPELVQNRISANRLEDIEQMRAAARPMELEKIAGALGVPADWFVADAAAGQTEAASAARGAEGEVAQRLDRIEQILIGLGEAVSDMSTRGEADEPPQAARGSST